jgi:hypothetical protein
MSGLAAHRMGSEDRSKPQDESGGRRSGEAVQWPQTRVKRRVANVLSFEVNRHWERRARAVRLRMTAGGVQMAKDKLYAIDVEELVWSVWSVWRARRVRRCSKNKHMRKEERATAARGRAGIGCRHSPVAACAPVRVPCGDITRQEFLLVLVYRRQHPPNKASLHNPSTSTLIHTPPGACRHARREPPQ